MTIGERIRAKRLEKKLTQKQLAVISGVAEITIRSYENEKRLPQATQLGMLAKALGSSIDYFFIGRDPIYSVFDNPARSKEAFCYLESLGFKIRESDSKFAKWHLENVEHGIDLVIEEDKLLKTVFNILSDAEARNKLYIMNRLIIEFS